jgi:hypothetical protein
VINAELHTFFISKFGHTSGDLTVFIQHQDLIATLSLLASEANKKLFSGWDERSIAEVKPFFKTEEGYKVYDKDGQQVEKWDWQTACSADFILAYHGVYAYERKMKLVVKMTQIKIRDAFKRQQAAASRFTLDSCVL